MIGIAGVWVAYDLVGAVRWFAEDYRRLWQVGLAVMVGAPLLLIFMMLPASGRQRLGIVLLGHRPVRLPVMRLTFSMYVGDFVKGASSRRRLVAHGSGCSHGLGLRRMALVGSLGAGTRETDSMMNQPHNHSRQPMPGERLGFSPTPATRHGCVQRLAK